MQNGSRELFILPSAVAATFLALSALTPVSAEDTKQTTAGNFIEQNCLTCHNDEDKAGQLNLNAIDLVDLRQDSATWEKIVRKLRSRQMPPSEMVKPTEEEYLEVLSILESALDREALKNPQPGRTATFRRLNRAEYQNAIRDLLALEIDAATLLPSDESSHGFDNVTVGTLSPTLLNRYISAAQKISRLAIGSPQKHPSSTTFRIPPDVTQEERVEGLPIGTRGGMLIPYTFPQDGDYEITIRLARDRDEHVEGLRGKHEVELMLDLTRIEVFTVEPPAAEKDSDYYTRPSHANVDQHLKARVTTSAGPHTIGVAFLKNPSSLLETKRQPLNVHFNMYRHPRITPAIYQVTVVGPINSNGPGDTPSRAKALTSIPTNSDEEEACATQNLAKLMRRAYRRPVNEQDLESPMTLYREGRAAGDFESGIELALSSILVNPHFLFRIENDPIGVASQAAYRVDDIALASRLSFFLWSSIPDDQLLALAERNKLSEPAILAAQVKRMLADHRSRALVNNFAGQWLYLRNLDSISPDMRLYPDFDDNLRQAFRRETELLFASVMDEDRSVLDLLTADYTFLNERLAKHYGIPHVHGSRFRRVSLDPGSKRGGLLRQGSVLTVTSYATRTSPVLRGKWVLENLLGSPPPPPPADVPALEDNTVSANLSVRERLAEHRANPACAVCHDSIDPIGFALENFDAVGRWRDFEGEQPVDASGGLPDGTKFVGIEGLERGLIARPELFAGTMAEKLLTYALGRGIEPSDAPAIRQIVRSAEASDFRFSSLILAIVNSTPFQMRISQ